MSAPAPPAADAIREQLERILAAAPFANAERLSRFLRFVIERTLAGDGDQLKEYVIGTEVFDRAADYDPRLDSIVRVEARRLRSKLDEYYQGPGRADRVVISVPRGSYVPLFDWRPAVSAESAVPAAAPAPRARPRRLALGLLGAAAVVVVVAAGWPRSPVAPEASSRPSIAVLPFEHYSTAPDVALIAARLTDGLTSNLARAGDLSVVSRTSAAEQAGRPLRAIADALGADIIVEGSVVVEGGVVRVSARLVNPQTERKAWVGEYTAAPDELADLPPRVAADARAAALRVTAARPVSR